MRTNRKRSVVGAAALVNLVLTLAACGDDDDDGEAAQTETEEATEQTSAAATTEGETGSTTETTSAATTEPETGSTTEPTSGSPTTEPASGDHVCPHITNLVLVQNKTPDVEPAIPSDLGMEVLDPNRLPEFLGWELPPLIDVGEILTGMFAERSITAYQIIDGPDSLDAAVAIEDVNEDGAVVATPLLLLTLTGHWTMSPWGLPEAAADGTVPTGSVDDRIVAVVDTGYTVATGEFEWLNQRVGGLDPSFDADPDDPTGDPDVAGHGKFVSSVITQEANVLVRVARLGATGNSAVPTGLQSQYTADELLLYIAIQRLLQPGLSYSALNLSLGAYACEGLENKELAESVADNSGLAIRAAVDLWQSAFPDSNAPILAAAGNHEPGDTSALPPFLPAAYAANANDNVFSVMSVNDAGNQSDFSNPGMCGASGELLGVGAGDEWVYWRGSSFATALLTARTVLGGGTPPCPFTTPDHVSIAPPTTTPPSTTASSTSGNVTTTTRPPTSATTTTIG